MTLEPTEDAELVAECHFNWLYVYNNLKSRVKYSACRQTESGPSTLQSNDLRR
jgi:hypothetical protein